MIIKCATGNLDDENFVFINSSFYMLKCYHDLFGKNTKHEWLDFDYSINSTIENYVNNLLEQKIDVFAAGIYCWNNSYYTEVAKLLKKKDENVKVIFGGPDITARLKEDWFEENCFVDYVVYGDGEKSFSNLIDYLSYENIDLSSIPNLIWSKNKKRIINKHEIMRDQDYWNVSPWLHCKDVLLNDVKRVTERNKIPRFLWERARGCPYECSFCDWSGGLHKKVTRRKYDFRFDVDLITNSSEKSEINLVDANVGIFKEDYDIIDYIMKGEQREKRKLIDIDLTNWAKNNKERVFDIIEVIMNVRKSHVLKVSQQDMNEDVLRNIDRPGVSWLEHKKFLLNANSKYKDCIGHIELIVGLPGQTREGWLYNLKESQNFPNADLILPFWQLLPYSPANSKEYLEKFKVKTVKAYQPLAHTHIFYDEIFDREKRDEMIEGVLKDEYTKSFFSEILVSETFSFDFEDLIYFYVTGLIYNKLMNVKNRIAIIEQQKAQIESVVSTYHKIFTEDLKRHNAAFLTFL